MKIILSTKGTPEHLTGRYTTVPANTTDFVLENAGHRDVVHLLNDPDVHDLRIDYEDGDPRMFTAEAVIAEPSARTSEMTVTLYDGYHIHAVEDEQVEIVAFKDAERTQIAEKVTLTDATVGEILDGDGSGGLLVKLDAGKFECTQSNDEGSPLYFTCWAVKTPGMRLWSRFIQDVGLLKNFKMPRIVNSLNKLHSDMKLNFKQDRFQHACITGNLVLEWNQVDRDVPIADPNGAVAGAFKRSLVLLVKNSKGEIIDTLNDTKLTLTPGKVGVGFSDPTILPASPAIVNGRAAMDLIYTTDEGSGEVYAEDDTVTLAADYTICGNDLTQVVYTDTLIA